MAIYKEDIATINLEAGNIFRSFVKHTIGTADSAADRFGIRVMRGEEEVDLSGCSCYGYFKDPHGNNIALTSQGTVDGNVAYVTLPQACYNYEGQFCLAIKLIGGGVTGTMRIVDGVVDNTNTGSAVAPTGTVPTYTEVLAAYDAAIAAVNDVNEVKNALGENVEMLSGSFVSNKWANSNYSAIIRVFPGSKFEIKAGGYSCLYMGMKSVSSIPPTVGDDVVYSEATGWTTNRSVSANTTETGTIPLDVNYLYIYAGASTSYTRFPTKIAINGIDILGSAFEMLSGIEIDMANKANFTTFFSSTPINVAFGSNGNSITIPANGRILLGTGASAQLPGATLTFSASKWVSYDITSGAWVLDDYDANKELLTIGWVSTVQKTAFFAADYKITLESEQKTIAFMGDSITAGVGVASAEAFHMYLHDRYGWTCLNYGYGGAGYFKSYTGTSSGRLGTGEPGIGPAITAENAFTPNNVAARLAELDPSELDGIVIFAGTNDWGNDVSVSDFISGIEAAFTYCKTYLTAVPVLVMTPIHRKNDTTPNSSGKTLREYADIIISECQKYSMAYVDTMTMTGMYPDNDANCALFFPDNLTTGLHPGTEGHKRLASVIGETLKEIINCKTF